MGKLLITESERNLILSMYNNLDITTKIKISEQTITNHDKTYDYKKEGDKYYYKLKNENNWVLANESRSVAIKDKVFNQTNKTTSNPKTVNTSKPKTVNTSNTTVKNDVTMQGELGGYCQTITKNSTDIKNLSGLYNLYKSKYNSFTETQIYGQINKMVNSWSKLFTNQGIPKEISCEMALNQIRPGYDDKNLIVVDTYNKLLYVFDKDGKFIGKTVFISGKNKQSVDPKVIAASLLTWDEEAKRIGFKWVRDKGYIDQTGKGRKYDPELVYADTNQRKGRFLPKGIYTTSSTTASDPEYAGKKNNVVSLFDGNKEITQAIHGYYVEAPRTEALRAAKKVISSPNDPRIGKDFLKLVRGGDVNLSQSYGCINLPSEFLPTLRKYVANSYIFNIGEDRKNYLVQSDKVENYLDKMMSSDSCPSPESVGAVPLEGLA